MKRTNLFLVSALIGGALALSVKATAADLGGPKAPAATVEAPAATFNWSGFYLGGSFGADISTDAKDLMGLHVGYRHQQGMVVYGAEIGASTLTVDLPRVVQSVTIHDFSGMMFTATGSVGIAMDRMTIYGKGGYAWLDKLDGYTYGAGAAYAVTNHVSVGIEYMRTDFDKLNKPETVMGRLGIKF